MSEDTTKIVITNVDWDAYSEIERESLQGDFMTQSCDSDFLDMVAYTLARQALPHGDTIKLSNEIKEVFMKTEYSKDFKFSKLVVIEKEGKTNEYTIDIRIPWSVMHDRFIAFMERIQRSWWQLCYCRFDAGYSNEGADHNVLLNKEERDRYNYVCEKARLEKRWL
jgi:hypothetical protein